MFDPDTFAVDYPVELLMQFGDLLILATLERHQVINPHLANAQIPLIDQDKRPKPERLQ